MKWAKHIVTFKEEKDEHILVEEGSQIECDTVFHRDTSHREFHPRNIGAKRLPREACFDFAMSKWTKTFSWRMDLKLNTHGVSQGHMPQ